MNYYQATAARALKRLRAAVGYYELGMSRHAINQLDSLLQLGDTGPFRLAAEILRAEFLKASADSGTAAQALGIAACMLRPPEDEAL
jgi:hypothetical protein